MSALANLLTDMAQFLDAAKPDYARAGYWSDWDQSIRDRITVELAALDWHAVTCLKLAKLIKPNRSIQNV